MRLLVINPNTTQAMTEAIGAVASAVAAPDTELTWRSPDAGPRSIEGFTDETLAAARTVELVARTRGEYDGYAIACFGDPGLAACREAAAASRASRCSGPSPTCSSPSTEGRWCSRSRCRRRRGESKPNSARSVGVSQGERSNADR